MVSLCSRKYDPGCSFRIPDPDPDFTHPGSRIQGSKRHLIPDPDPQYWFVRLLRLADRAVKVKFATFLDSEPAHSTQWKVRGQYRILCSIMSCKEYYYKSKGSKRVWYVFSVRYCICFEWLLVLDLSSYQCCGSGSWSGLDLNSSRAKMTYKNRKKLINFIFWSAGCSLLRAEGFSCSLNVL